MKLIVKFLLILVFAGFSISCQSNSSLVTTAASSPLPTTTPIENKLPETSTVSSPITCSDKELSGIWRTLEKDADFPHQADVNIGEDCSDYIKIDKRFDLNNDGVKELFVKGTGTWGAASTLPIWVMQKKNNRYKVLLKEQGESFDIKKITTNGYRDLYFPSRRNIMSTFLSTYKFNGKKYYRTKCQIEFYYDPEKLRKLFNCDDEKGIKRFEDKFASTH